jgi:hypothetical protein
MSAAVDSSTSVTSVDLPEFAAEGGAWRIEETPWGGFRSQATSVGKTVSQENRISTAQALTNFARSARFVQSV